MHTLKKKISHIFLAISLFLLFYTFYRSEIYWSGAERSYYFKYYIVSIVLIILSIILFFVSQKLKEYITISILSIIIAIYSFEAYLIIKKNNSDSKILKQNLFKKETGNNWDTREKIEIYNDLKELNSNIVVSQGPGFYKKENYSIFTLSNISNSKTIVCNENGYYSIYESDRYGFNNPDEEWDSKKIEYLLVGDSFTQGHCVNRPHDIASVLRNLSDKSVLNLGFGGNGPLTEYATLIEYLKPNVKTVLWMYYEDDLNNLHHEMNNEILISYLNNESFKQNLRLRQNEIDKITRDYIQIHNSDINKTLSELKKSNSFITKFSEFIKLYYLRRMIFTKKIKLPVSDFKKILNLTKNLTNKNNSILYFVYLPDYSRYTSNKDNNYNLIKDIVSELNIPFIDLHEEVFKNEKNPLNLFPFKLQGHYNVSGYEKVARTIYENISNKTN